MEIEYEATFININKDECREKIKNIGAELIKPEFLQKRICFNLPKGYENEFIFARVRDEQDKITMTYKEISGKNIEDQKEVNLTINDFNAGVEFLEKIGCKQKSYQETKRELWKLNNVEICIDEWPFLEPYIEIEGKSEKEVKDIAQIMGFDYSKALFCGVAPIYELKYNIPSEIINNKIPKIVFDMENPFINYKKNDN
jgi:adenylate cyclase, class 2